MTAPDEAIPRLQMIACPYELIANDLLVNDDDGTWRRVVSQTGAKTVTVSFDDGTTQNFPRRTFLTVYRDQTQVPGFSNVEPFIVA